jgi:hypothetical protein
MSRYTVGNATSARCPRANRIKKAGASQATMGTVRAPLANGSVAAAAASGHQRGRRIGERSLMFFLSAGV